MTKQNYIAVAKIISENKIVNHPELVDKNLLISELGYYFKQDNPSFDEKRFAAACK